MRNSSTRFVSLLLAVVMVFSLALTGYAAERTPLLVLHGDEKEPVLNGRVTVCVDTTVDAVLADGKLTIRYDSQKLQFLSAKGGEAWRDNTDLSLQVNSNEAGKLVVLVIDVHGAANIRRMFPGATTVFLLPPSVEELEHRLRGRGTETEESIRERLATAQSELAEQDKFTLKLVNNEVASCAEELYQVICRRAGIAQ